VYAATRPSLYSFEITSFSDIDTIVAVSMIAATADRPTMWEPENSFSQPIIDRPTKPPSVATRLTKESPPNGGWLLLKQASTNPNGLVHPNELIQKAPPRVNRQVLS
jgi:hypothetical protein